MPLPGSRWTLAMTALMAGVVLSGCGGDASGASDEDAAPVQRVINVEVLPLASEDFEEVIRVTGTVQAIRDVVISTEEAGVVRELLVARGAAVREGDPLLRIDARILETQLREAEARAALAREGWERRRRLFEVDGIGSELAYLEARYQFEQAEAVLETLAERLARTVVRAPISGIVEDRLVEVGTMVSAGTPVARLVQTDPIKVLGGIPERFAGDVRAGAQTRVTFDVLPEQTFAGSVRFAGATVSARNRTFEIEILVPNPNRVIKPEMVANIEVSRRRIPDAVVVPQEAVVRVENGFVAFVAEAGDGGDVARVRPVVIGTSQQNRIVIESGLEPGERLIVTGQNQLADGDRIQVVGSRTRVQEGEVR